jgi:hypothetical protein
MTGFWTVPSPYFFSKPVYKVIQFVFPNSLPAGDMLLDWYLKSGGRLSRVRVENAQLENFQSGESGARQHKVECISRGEKTVDDPHTYTLE